MAKFIQKTAVVQGSDIILDTSVNDVPDFKLKTYFLYFENINCTSGTVDVFVKYRGGSGYDNWFLVDQATNLQVFPGAARGQRFSLKDDIVEIKLHMTSVVGSYTVTASVLVD